jgi:hypothetical protein
MAVNPSSADFLRPHRDIVIAVVDLQVRRDFLIPELIGGTADGRCSSLRSWK